jgi:hypothetical protein
MTSDEAAAIIKGVCSQYRGTLEEHNQIQQALAIVLDPPAVDDGAT